jgi:hypothetical protein
MPSALIRKSCVERDLGHGKTWVSEHSAGTVEPSPGAGTRLPNSGKIDGMAAK